MSAASNYLENAVIDWIFGGATPTRPSSRYVALHTGDPGETGASSELSGNGYARQAATFGAASSGAATNSGALTFTASGGAFGTITHCSVWDAVTAGNCLYKGACTNKTIADGDTYQFATGQLSVSLD